MTCVHLQVGIVLVRDVVGFPLRDEYVLGSGLHASIRAAMGRHLGTRMRGHHFRVTTAAHAVANLAASTSYQRPK